MTSTLTRIFLALALSSSIWLNAGLSSQSQQPQQSTPPIPAEASITIQYLEIVSTDVDAVCATLSAIHSVSFGEPEPDFGNARIAVLGDGGRLGVRAPLSDNEAAGTVRPYLRVDDIDAAIAAAQASGAQFAMLATEIPGHGKFAIYFQGGVQFGLWEL